MRGFYVLSNSNLSDRIASDFMYTYAEGTKIGSMERKAVILERFSRGEMLTEDEVKEANITLTSHGFNVYEDTQGRTWWLEGGKIYRPDDELIHTSVEQYLKAQKIQK
jgi:hypothetical protein